MPDIGTFSNFIEKVRNPIIPPSLSLRPIIFRLNSGEGDIFHPFCKEQHIQIIDTIDRQLADVARVTFPSDQEQRTREDFLTDLLADHADKATYGNWVYLPWQAKIFHALPEEDYFNVITSRNRYKITREEQEILRTKRIGVVGLSVGAEAAVTVAQEHLCGEIVIADFDDLELSNLNRLNAGLDELGLAKTTITARRIAGINPYLTITVFEDGVHDTNMNQFLEGLDLLLEECDNLALKFKIREAAKRRSLNVIYAADERGLLSIEPYAYAESLPVFHGKVKRSQPPKESYPLSRDFWKALTEWLGGWEQISERSRDSVLHIGTSLCSYPQLASEARFAAGQVGHVARRLLLGEKIPPALQHHDLHKSIS